MVEATTRSMLGQSAAGVTVDFSPLRFLIVDDNAFMRRLVRSLLAGFGGRHIVEAEDGASGFAAVGQSKPDIVFVDWEMPNLDGLELTRRIRNQPPDNNPFLPVIMITGHAEKKRVLVARDAGVTEFIVKPITAKALYSRVLSVVAKPRAFVRTAEYFGPDRRRHLNAPHTGAERRTNPPLNTSPNAKPHNP
jgi:two-component system, chemotaxis family, chemotaxis protein CheY